MSIFPIKSGDSKLKIFKSQEKNQFAIVNSNFKIIFKKEVLWVN